MVLLSINYYSIIMKYDLKIFFCILGVITFKRLGKQNYSYGLFFITEYKVRLESREMYFIPKA